MTLTQFLKCSIILNGMTLVIHKGPDSVMIPPTRGQGMEVFSVRISIQCPFSTTFEFPSQKVVFQYFPFFRSELRQGQLFLVSENSIWGIREKITDILIHPMWLRLHRRGFLFDWILYIILEKTELVGKEIQNRTRRIRRRSRPPINDPGYKIMILKPRLIEFKWIVTGPKWLIPFKENRIVIRYIIMESPHTVKEEQRDQWRGH